MTWTPKSSKPGFMNEDFATVESLGGVFHPHALEIQDFSSYALILDVRSRADYENDHIPGARQVDPAGLTRAGPGIPVAPSTSVLVARDSAADELLAEVTALVSNVRFDEAILIYCGRGGLDSQPLAQALRWRGWTVDVLPGGWINYRRWVQAGLEALPRMVMFRAVSCALSCETESVLQALQAAGQQVLDIKGLALGVVDGLKVERPSQAWFESQLLQAMRCVDPRASVWVADREPPLGPLRWPGALLDALFLAPVATVSCGIGERVQHWRHHLDDFGDVLKSVDQLEPRPAAADIQRWRELVVAGDLDQMLVDMLREYFDVRLAEHLAAHASARRELQPLALRSFAVDDLAEAVAAWPPASAPAEP